MVEQHRLNPSGADYFDIIHLQASLLSSFPLAASVARPSDQQQALPLLFFSALMPFWLEETESIVLLPWQGMDSISHEPSRRRKRVSCDKPLLSSVLAATTYRKGTSKKKIPARILSGGRR